MLNRHNMDSSLPAFSCSINYFTQLIQAREQNDFELEYQKFSNNLTLLKLYVEEEYSQALTNNDITTRNYILNFSEKLEKLKIIVETSSSYEAVNDALDNVMNAVKRPIGVDDALVALVSVIAGIAAR